MKTTVILVTLLILQVNVRHSTCKSATSKSQFKDLTTVLPKKVTRLSTSQIKDPIIVSPKTISNLPTSKSADSTTVPLKTAPRSSTSQFKNSTTVLSKTTSKLSSSQFKESTTISPKPTFRLFTSKSTAIVPSRTKSQLKNSTTVSPNIISHSSTSKSMDLKTTPLKTTLHSATSQFKNSTTVLPKTASQLSTSQFKKSTTVPPKITSLLSTLKFMNSTTVLSETTSQLKNLAIVSTKNIPPLPTLKAIDSATISHSVASQFNIITTIPPKVTSTSQFKNSTNVPHKPISQLGNSTTVLLKTTPKLFTSKSADSTTVAPKTNSQLDNLTTVSPKTTSQLPTSKSTDSTTVAPKTKSQLENSTTVSPETTSHLSSSQFEDSTTAPLETTSHLPASQLINSTIVSPKTISSSSTLQFVKSENIPPETTSHLSTSKSLDSGNLALETTSHFSAQQFKNSTTAQSQTISHLSTSQSMDLITISAKTFEYQLTKNTAQSNISHYSSSHQTPTAQELSITSTTTLEEPYIKELIGFENLITSPFYVDKTLLLKALFYNNLKSGESLLITMPKGFGKTTNLEMVKRFCEIEVNRTTGLPITKDLSYVDDTPNYKLFTTEYNYGPLKISQSSNFMEKHFGKYPVIYLNFAIPQGNFDPSMDGTIKWMKRTISKAFIQHQYLVNSSKLEIEQKNKVLEWCDYTSHKLLSAYDVATSLLTLIDYLYIHYSKEVIVLIDEYDSLARWAIESIPDEDEMRRILDFYICIFSNALRDQPELEFAVFTGVIHIDYSRFRVALPDLRTHRLGRSKEFVEFYGFTSEEVDSQLRKIETEIDTDVALKAIKYYGGYSTVDGEKIYTPVSITRFLHQKKILNYWSKEITITNNWPALRSFRIRMIMLHLLVDNGSTKIKNMYKLSFEDISALRNCIDAKKEPIFSSTTVSIFYNYILDLGYLKITSQNDDYVNVTMLNIETSEALKLLLDIYYNKTATGAEFQIQTDFVNALKSISMVNHHEKIQQITMNLNQMVKTMSSQADKFQEDLKYILREVFMRHDVHSYGKDQVRIPTEEDKEKHGLADFFLTNLQDIYIIIETEFQSTLRNGLLTIKNKHLPRIFDSVMNNSTMKKSYLLLGINLQHDGTVAISAKYTNIRCNFTTERNYTS